MQTGDMTVRRMLGFNLGQYEQHVIEVTITGIPGDTPPEDIALKLDELMLPDIIRAGVATSHPPEDNRTAVYEWRKIAEGEYA